MTLGFKILKKSEGTLKIKFLIISNILTSISLTYLVLYFNCLYK